ncbi:hypothetical protein Glove_50g104 [Diversispora epigaea]|uniref:Peptidase S8/S53 domain-containing protein n=1 Tax=Diversispora epigaea TaxID=1348612 RepID=A0A397JFY9_9GLOM|nr:hypothetical protein Glove_50g104 [Diversispora epigaea]
MYMYSSNFHINQLFLSPLERLNVLPSVLLHLTLHKKDASFFVSNDKVHYKWLKDCYNRPVQSIKITKTIDKNSILDISIEGKFYACLIANFPLNNGYVFPSSAGSGATVYVVDTILGAFCDDYADTDDNGNGSHVSGIVGGKTFNVAKNVDIVGIKVLYSQGSGTLADIINSFSFVIDDVISKKNNAIL